jgi:thioredoxin-related protein
MWLIVNKLHCEVLVIHAVLLFIYLFSFRMKSMVSKIERENEALAAKIEQSVLLTPFVLFGHQTCNNCALLLLLIA